MVRRDLSSAFGLPSLSGRGPIGVGGGATAQPAYGGGSWVDDGSGTGNMVWSPFASDAAPKPAPQPAYGGGSWVDDGSGTGNKVYVGSQQPGGAKSHLAAWLIGGAVAVAALGAYCVGRR